MIDLEPEGGNLYLKLISKTSYSTPLRTLSNIEAVSSEEFEHDSSLINTVVILLSGMELIILLINLILFFLRPSLSQATYIILIIISILLVNVVHQSFIGLIDISAWKIHQAEIILNILLVGAYTFFTAFYLKAYQHSKVLFYILVFPFFIIQLAFINEDNSLFLKVSSGLYFVLFVLANILLIIKVWNKERHNCLIYIIANIPPILAATLTILAINGILPSTYLTTKTVYISLLIRDAIFTLAWLKDYFQLQEESLSSKVQINQLKEEKKQLKRVEKFKTQFFNNVSHELKTPLSLIISPLESSLKNEKLVPAIKKDLNLSLKNSKYLLQLVNEMLDLAKLDDAELVAVCQPTDITKLITNIQHNLQDAAQYKDQIIVLNPSEKTIVAYVDQDKFEKIITILISNAIKYSNKSGSIYIKIDKHKKDLNIEVRDEGIGISQNDLARIFDRYFQSENSSKTGGTGIGLFIVKEFMELHQGKVECLSELGKGTTFKLTFPNAIEEYFEEDAPTLISSIDQAKQSILFVEDDAFMRTYLKEKLSEYNSMEAADGQEALNKLEKGVLPDLILTDYMMPNIDGYELALRLKSNPKWRDIPIIFLTAKSLSSEKVKILNLGIDDYVIKPFNLDELKVRIQNALNFSISRKKPLQKEVEDLDNENLQSFKIKLDNFILKNLKNAKLSNEFLSKKLNLSERNLFRKVRAVTGQTPASYIREIRIQKARELMDNEPQMNISEIAQECGMDNLAHFSQSFKKRFGKTPKEYTSISN
ncbi:ATP-binding protein [Marivirga salinae]|uniref:histidine kinase n=1 Tax=Marivirga salinarum TaxID=3059078 RepID=A0AA51RE37_9BACT|nr:ATP-binding protein [Marivirga sp. BDSF4-3]WMN10905.1 ATP-binding protein [Marivirga sp. BDSF4-3]